MRRRGKPAYAICSVKGCGCRIPTWKRLCDACWRMLPFEQRRAIAQAGEDKAPHRVAALVIEAARWLQEHKPAAGGRG